MAGTVTLMCGPAGAGKTRYARALEQQGALRLSFDAEHWRRGYREPHPPPAVIKEVERDLWQQLMDALPHRDVVLDYAFSTRAMRDDYRGRLAALGARTVLVHVTAPPAVLAERVARRRGAHADDVALSPETLARYMAGFEVPTADEDPVVVDTGRL